MMAVQSGRAVPPRLLEPPPEVQTGLELYMRAFFDLAGDRKEGGRIAWSTVQGWCDAMRLEPDDAADVHFLVRRMDMAYLEWSRAKTKRMSVEKKMAEDKKTDGNPRGIRGQP